MRPALLAAISILAVTAEAQSGRSVTVKVKTTGGQPVPYALVSVDGSTDRIADSNGALAVVLDARESVRVSARRIGFRPFDGWVRRAANNDAFEAAMTPLAAVIDTVRVTVRQSTPRVGRASGDQHAAGDHYDRRPDIDQSARIATQR